MTGRANWRHPGYAAAYAWLARDYLANLEMILPLLHESLISLTLAGTPPTLRGVLIQCDHPFRGGHCYRLDVLDAAALADLITVGVAEPPTRWLVHRPWLDPLLRQRYGLAPTGFGIYSYATSRPSTIPPAGRRLTREDRDLVAWSECGWSATDFDHLLQYRHPWAIVLDDRIVCRASSGYETPWTGEVLGLWTHPGYRGRQLARSLVAAIVADILTRKPLASYNTTFDNLPSLRVVESAGFRRVTTATEYVGGAHVLSATSKQ